MVTNCDMLGSQMVSSVLDELDDALITVPERDRIPRGRIGDSLEMLVTLSKAQRDTINVR